MRFLRHHGDCLKFCSFVYEPSSVVVGVINYLEEQRNSLLDLQEKHGVKVWHIMFLFSCVFKSIVALVTFLIYLASWRTDTLRNRYPVCWNGWSLGLRVDMEGDNDGLCNGWWRFSPSAQTNNGFTSSGMLLGVQILYVSNVLLILLSIFMVISYLICFVP